MKEQQPKLQGRALAEQEYKNARANLLLMLILTVVNVVLYLVGADVMMLFSATVPYYAVAFAFELGAPLVVPLMGIALVSLAAYLLCWIFSKKHYGWMIAALVLFVLDSLALVGLYLSVGDASGILDTLIHVWVLWCLIKGVKYGHQLKTLPPEEKLPEQPTDITPPADQQPPLVL